MICVLSNHHSRVTTLNAVDANFQWCNSASDSRCLSITSSVASSPVQVFNQEFDKFFTRNFSASVDVDSVFQFLDVVSPVIKKY